MCSEACEDAELLAAAKHIKIKADIVPALCVKGDAVMLRRVALNLIDNAVKFNRTDGRLELALQVADGEAVFTIANTGTGIPPERQGALFERFFRVGAERNRDAGGSGLGLSLCREIITAHRVRIGLSRSAEDWTEFRICLPTLAELKTIGSTLTQVHSTLSPSMRPSLLKISSSPVTGFFLRRRHRAGRLPRADAIQNRRRRQL